MSRNKYTIGVDFGTHIGLRYLEEADALSAQTAVSVEAE